MEAFLENVKKFEESKDLQNKEFAKSAFAILLTPGLLDYRDFENLLSKEWCSNTVGSSYAVLRKIDPKKNFKEQLKNYPEDNNRYYAFTGHLFGETVVITSQWDGKGITATANENRPIFRRWLTGKIQIFLNDRNIIPPEPVSNNIASADAITKIQSYISAKGFTYDSTLIENLYCSMKAKPFVLLAGTSGTGKTRIARLFAEAVGATSAADNGNGRYLQVAVQPNWADSSDLLGYFNLGGDFVPGRMLKFLLRAQQDISRPYFLCLDEMNLARVEYYFSDFLSVMETRDWLSVGDRRIISTDDILDAKALEYITGHRSDFGLSETMGQQSLWGDNNPLKHLHIPENLYIIGTVNMDESTFPFSRKVLDRASTIEFSDVNMKAGLDEASTVADAKPLALGNSFFRTDYLTLKECLAQQDDTGRALIEDICTELEELNGILAAANAQVGYRVRDEAVFYMMAARELYGDLPEADKKKAMERAMDMVIMQKLLPRLQGSSMKLKRVMVRLLYACCGQVGPANNSTIDEMDMDEIRNQAKEARYHRSARKLTSMLQAYADDGFCSFWG